jgi:hypothetical protein
MKQFKLLKPLVMFFLMVFFSTLALGQATIHCWDFNAGNSGTAGSEWPSPVNTAARITGTGLIVHNITNTAAFTGSTINACDGSASGLSFSLVDQLNNGNYFTLEFPTSGFENIILSFWARRTSTGFSNNTLDYSTDGGINFTTLTTFNPSSTTGGALESFDFSAISGANDNPNFQIRITLNGASSGAGNNRYDNIKLTGTPIGTSTATKLAVTQINAGNPVFVDQPFSVTVQSQDQYGIPQNVTSNVSVQLSKATGTGTLGGTLSGLIVSGTNSVTISGVTYNVAETGVSITASTLFGGLDPGTSALFEVLSAPIPVANIAALRAGVLGGNYTLTGEAVLTFQQAFRNQKYIQDATAAILIDDAPNGNFDPGIISTVYNLGDGIMGITGTLTEFGNMMQFVPLFDPGTAASSGNVITPQTITLSQLLTNFEDFEAELVQINNVTFVNGGAIFANGQAYAVSDGSKANFNFRTTFFDVDYIGTEIPYTANLVVLPNSRTDGDYITSRSLADIVSTGLPLITKAYAINSTSVDVFYNANINTVDPADYYLLGTANTSFTGAVIDGVNPKLVHLTGATPAMTGDLILDQVNDDNIGSVYDFYAGISSIANTNTTNPGGTMLNGIDATFTGIVSGNNGTSRVWVSDAAGAFNGVLIFNNTLPSEVAVGDNITFTAVRDEFNNLTELINPTLISINSSGNTPYGPTLIPGSDIASTIAANTNPAESFEGQLVKIDAFTVDSLSAFGTNYACSWSDGVDTYVFYIGTGAGSFSLAVGGSYTSVTGLVDWYWTGNFYRINPRNQDDIEGGVLPPVPHILITEIMQDPFAVPDADGEWFEIFNNEDTPVDLTGYLLKDDGTDSHVITGPLVVPAKGFAVLGRNADPLVNGGYTVDYQYSSFVLGNSDDEVVLLLPDGVTEVARVNYTGTAPWPDPTGASMIFTGLTTADNNDPGNWSVAVVREPSYTGTEGDLGSPGTNGTGQNLISDDLFLLELKVYLEGPFDVGANNMSTGLKAANLLPNNHPFNPTLPYYGNNTPKWLYNGAGTALSLPANAVDWVLVELRDALSAASATSATSIAKKPGLLLSDGSVVAPNGVSPLGFNVVINDYMFIVVWSRNHLAIMSSSGMTNPTGTLSYDFTTSAGQVYGTNGSKELTTGVWGMFSGDVNADGIVNDADKAPAGWNTEAGEKGYFGSDMNLNSETDNVDKNDFWLPNYLKSSQVPN